MSSRYDEILIEVPEGITFNVSEKTNRKGKKELIIEVVPESNASKKAIITEADGCLENYANPPIPRGYNHICGEWNDGFTIERHQDGSEFIWIPVGFLDQNGTLDGTHFTDRFGRRDYKDCDVSKFTDDITDELLKQVESVRRYGGFYISKYLASCNVNGKICSIEGRIPWSGKFDGAQRGAASFENNAGISSHLTFGAEYDSVLEWCIKSGIKTINELTSNSASCGNQFHESRGTTLKEWTQEKRKGLYERAVRGGLGNDFAAERVGYSPEYYAEVGFRVVLCIK